MYFLTREKVPKSARGGKIPPTIAAPDPHLLTVYDVLEVYLRNGLAGALFDTYDFVQAGAVSRNAATKPLEGS